MARQLWSAAACTARVDAHEWSLGWMQRGLRTTCSTPARASSCIAPLHNIVPELIMMTAPGVCSMIGDVCRQSSWTAACCRASCRGGCSSAHRCGEDGSARRGGMSNKGMSSGRETRRGRGEEMEWNLNFRGDLWNQLDGAKETNSVSDWLLLNYALELPVCIFWWFCTVNVRKPDRLTSKIKITVNYQW